MHASMQAGSMFQVASSISANTGLAPTYRAQLAEAAKVIGVVMSSSPGPRPIAITAMWRAAVSLEHRTACFAPVTRQSFSSHSVMWGPVVR